MNKELKTPELIAQWVIDNRYPKSESGKTDDREMYTVLTESISALLPSELLKQNKEMRSFLNKINNDYKAFSDLNSHGYGEELEKLIESTNP